MASSLTGVVVSEVGGPDYPERPFETCARLRAAGFLNKDEKSGKAIDAWEKDYLSRGLTKKEAQAEKFLWLRSHYRPVELSSQVGTGAEVNDPSPTVLVSLPALAMLPPESLDPPSSLMGADSIAEASIAPKTLQPNFATAASECEELLTSVPMPMAFPPSGTLPPTSTSPVLDPPPTDPEPTEDAANPGYPKRKWAIEPDNSGEIDFEDSLVLTLDELLAAARFVLKNAHHIAARRAGFKSRDLPPMTWGLAVMFLDTPDKFLNWVSTKLREAQKPVAEAMEKVELAKIEADKEIALARERALQARKADNGPLRDVLERVETRLAGSAG